MIYYYNKDDTRKMVIGLYLTTFIASFFILIMLLLKHKQTTNIVLLFTIITTIQSFGRLIVAVTNNIEMAWLGMIFIYIGACYCPLIVVVVLNQLCRLTLSKWFLRIITGITVFVHLLTLTIGWSDIYYKSFHIVKGNGFNYLVKEYGPAHTLYLILIAMYFVIIGFCLFIAIKKYKKVSLRTIKPIIVLATIILSSYILEKILKSHVSYLSVGYFFSLLFCIYFLGHVNMFDMDTNVALCLSKRTTNGYIQFDDKFRCAGYNNKIEELFPEVTTKWTVDEKIPEDNSFLYVEIISWFLTHTKNDHKTIKVGENFYEMSINEISYGKKSCVGYILELFDRTVENKYFETVKNYNDDLKQEVYEKTKDILQINDAFGKAVDPYVRDYILEGHVSLGGESRDVSVMFCDIRSFTSLSESMPPEKVVSMLNFYFTVLGKCISKHNGIINKYIGDAVMAIFGAPVPSENNALDAYKAALDMRRALAYINKSFYDKGYPQIRFGIGIHTGPVLAGNIGATNRMEYTVIGDTVNTASRVENLCKTYKTDLLITQSTAERLGPLKEKLNLIANAQIRGKEEKINLYN